MEYLAPLKSEGVSVLSGSNSDRERRIFLLFLCSSFDRHPVSTNLSSQGSVNTRGNTRYVKRFTSFQCLGLKNRNPSSKIPLCFYWNCTDHSFLPPLGLPLLHGRHPFISFRSDSSIGDSTRTSYVCPAPYLQFCPVYRTCLLLRRASQRDPQTRRSVSKTECRREKTKVERLTPFVGGSREVNVPKVGRVNQVPTLTSGLRLKGTDYG